MGKPDTRGEQIVEPERKDDGDRRKDKRKGYIGGGQTAKKECLAHAVVSHRQDPSDRRRGIQDHQGNVHAFTGLHFERADQVAPYSGLLRTHLFDAGSRWRHRAYRLSDIVQPCKPAKLRRIGQHISAVGNLIDSPYIG